LERTIFAFHRQLVLAPVVVQLARELLLELVVARPIVRL
jgi:hypothetical protein